MSGLLDGCRHDVLATCAVWPALPNATLVPRLIPKRRTPGRSLSRGKQPFRQIVSACAGQAPRADPRTALPSAMSPRNPRQYSLTTASPLTRFQPTDPLDPSSEQRLGGKTGV